MVLGWYWDGAVMVLRWYWDGAVMRQEYRGSTAERHHACFSAAGFKRVPALLFRTIFEVWQRAGALEATGFDAGGRGLLGASTASRQFRQQLLVRAWIGKRSCCRDD
jgi:hypothetical protein